MGRTPLYYCSLSGSEKGVNRLVNMGANVSGTDNYGYTPLIASAIGNNTQIAFYLINVGSNMEALANKKSKNLWQSVIHFTAKYGSVALLSRLLSEGFQYEARDFKGNSPFGLACGFGNMPVVKYMLENGYGRTTVKNLNGTIPLMMAASSGHVDVIKILLRYGPNELNMRDTKGNTALHYGALNGEMESVDILIECKANRTIQNRKGFTAEDVARKNGHLIVANRIRFSK